MPIKKGGIVTGKAAKGPNNTRSAAQRAANADARKAADKKREKRLASQIRAEAALHKGAAADKEAFARSSEAAAGMSGGKTRKARKARKTRKWFGLF